MNRFELMDRLSEELNASVHLNFADKNKSFTEEEYQETKESVKDLIRQARDDAHERLLRTDKKGHCRGNQISGQKFQNNGR